MAKCGSNGSTGKDNGMKYIFRIIRDIGFISMILGLGAMDNAVILPMLMMFVGLGAFYLGARGEDAYGR